MSTSPPTCSLACPGRRSHRPVAADLCDAPCRFGVSGRVLWDDIAPLLNGTTQISLDGRFQRRNHCLNYRAAPDHHGIVCGNCILLGTRRAATIPTPQLMGPKSGNRGVPPTIHNTQRAAHSPINPPFPASQDAQISG
jgi:hypothetical protein